MSLKVTHSILLTLPDSFERIVAFFFHLTHTQHVFYEHSALGFCLYCRLEYAVGMSVLIWCEQPRVPLWQQRAPCGLNTDISLYTLKQGFSTCLPTGRCSICGSPKPLWASFSLLPSTWAKTYPPEVKVSVERGSDSLTWGQSASRLKRGVLFLPAARKHPTASQYCTLQHSIKVLSLWCHFLLFSCSSVEPLQKLLTVFKDTLDHPREPSSGTLNAGSSLCLLLVLYPSLSLA